MILDFPGKFEFRSWLFLCLLTVFSFKCSAEGNDRLFVGILQSNVVLLPICQLREIFEGFIENKNRGLRLSVVLMQINLAIYCVKTDRHNLS